MPETSRITALLGPTNTGKTHRAIERMLEHDSGIIGLPLRLLAREVYDRLTARLGEQRVALVTGEEKRVPKRPDYFVCTVEAMPSDRDADFVAVDEVQLAADHHRGHVFTDRILRTRGRSETWFLGAETMRGVLSELVPTAKIEKHPRLSRLSFRGASKLQKLPPRSAVVAFSMSEVHAIAERLRVLRGGAAVVLGALSPRTRNAQVAMFQSGEVDYLVATDAIGMGLNLSIDHVAFAGLAKFDGRDVRGLGTAELAQIAGRAGRYLRDGTFGTALPIELGPEVARAIEEHHFASVRRLRWRNSDLDFSSIAALLATLDMKPTKPCVVRAEDAEDHAALARLASDPDIFERARGREAVELLWEVAAIPDYRKLLLETHVALLTELYLQLSGPQHAIDEAWMREQIRAIDDPAGDIDALLGRIAAIRTWTYVSNRSAWLAHAARWQEETRAIEDRLSDALHDKLVQRFVERGRGRRAAAPVARPRQRQPSTPEAAPAASPSHPFARLLELRASLAPATAPPVATADADADAVVAARHESFRVDADGAIYLDGERAGTLARGTSLLLPDAKVAGAFAELGAGARMRIGRRLVAFARDLANELVGALRSPSLRTLSPAARGVAYQIEQGLGTALVEVAETQVAALTTDDRAGLEDLGVVVGERVIWAIALFEREALEKRRALVRAWAGPMRLPPIDAVSGTVDRRVDPRMLLAVGLVRDGARVIRADALEEELRASVGPVSGADG